VQLAFSGAPVAVLGADLTGFADFALDFAADFAGALAFAVPIGDVFSFTSATIVRMPSIFALKSSYTCARRVL
jgi:hypothetical protein